jgi:hypothetical protein
MVAWKNRSVIQAAAEHSERAVHFLLRSEEPAIRYLTRRDLLDEEGRAEALAILSGPKVAALLSGPRPEEFRPGSGWRSQPGAEFGFGEGAYRNWAGAHWRLVSLVELGVGSQVERARMATEQVLGWLANPERIRKVPIIDGLARRCASQEGNALGVCCRLGLADDERVALLAASLIAWQWPDGGWNCDVKASGRRSSFHESLPPAWGLHEYAQASGDQQAQAAADRAAELFLSHRLFRSLSTGEPISRTWLLPHYPPYWHYDILQGLHILVRLGHAHDSRLEDAVAVLESRRSTDGTWGAGGYWWKLLGAGRDGNRGLKAWNVEVVDWGRSGPNEMITLNALRVLRAVGRLG